MAEPCPSSASSPSETMTSLLHSLRSHRLCAEAFERQRYQVQEESARARLEERIAYHQLQIAILLRRVAVTTPGRRVVTVRR